MKQDKAALRPMQGYLKISKGGHPRFVT